MVKQIKDRILRANALSTYKKVKDYTMIARNHFIDNLLLSIKFENIPGDVVECGVWRGGMIAGIAYTLKSDKHYFLFDSFEGLPAPKEIDGKSALEWADNKSDFYFNNCFAEIDFADNVMKQTGKKYSLVKGWFDQTIPDYDFPYGISLLRLDGDWYDSTMVCLKHLFPRVHTGGLILIDDYYTWDGCSRAVHDYLSSINSVSRISRTQNGVAYIIKLE